MNNSLPKPSLLRWEISLALAIKIVLLTGLWFLIFRWTDKPASKPDIAQHFALKPAHAAPSTQAQKEYHHDR